MPSEQAPLPLKDVAGNRQALRLRSLGMTYSQIAVVMGVYHGLWYGESAWRRRCRAMGAQPMHQRGFARRTEAVA